MDEAYRFVAFERHGGEERAFNLRIVAQDERAADSQAAPGWVSWKLADWSEAKSPHDRQKFAAWVGGTLVGFLNVRDGYPSAFEPDKKLLYVEHIATAPGNLLQDIWGIRLTGVGTSLMAFAVLQSMKHGHEGRIGLHAADQNAADYYEALLRKCQLFRSPKKEVPGTPEDRGARSRSYYESDPARARDFLEGYRDD